MLKKCPAVAIITDFGARDAYVAAMKGVLLSAVPGIPLVDVTHEIPPGNVLSAAYALASAWDYFPAGTVFLAVVDPGVGAARKALVGEAGGRFLVAPDNGISSLVLRLKGDGTSTAGGFTARELKTYFLKTEPSPTFHGRDVFAPAAALLARGRYRRLAGPELEPVILETAFSRKTGGRAVAGRIMHLDRFGNAITSIRGGEIDDPSHAEIEFVARGRFVKEPYRVRLTGVKRTFADAPEGLPLAYVGSLGFLELAVRNGSAAEKLGLRQNAPVRAGGKTPAADAPPNKGGGG
ncbi:MAG: SAM-dependent chlorinase/fluorinase [Spirochaetales bacterium]|nr:SAM-dependent chlorinase/fluorinase [Spirochaetales bacterium]